MSDRLRDAFSAILDALLPALATYVKWEYRVVGTSPGPPVTISASPVSASCPFGTLANITLWPGPTGGYALPAPGSLVLVEFHEGSPAKPSVCGLDPNVPPLMVTLGGPTALPVIPAPWGTALDTDLTTFSGTVSTITPPTTLPTVITAIAGIITAAASLSTSLAALPPGATIKVKAV